MFEDIALVEANPLLLPTVMVALRDIGSRTHNFLYGKPSLSATNGSQ